MSLQLVLGLVIIIVMAGIIVGLPIAFVFGASGLMMFLLMATADPILLMPTSMKLMQSFTLLALPLYILVGKLMEVGGLSDRLIVFLNALLGKGKNVFGGATIAFCAIFGAISGSAMSAIAAIGSMLTPKAVEQGYPKEYLVGLIACSALISMLIPPSLSMIVFGVAGKLSIAKCFLATAMPGILIALAYYIINFVQTRQFASVVQPYTNKRYNKELLRATKGASTALMLPVIILGGIYGGVCTPTEAAAIAVVWITLDGLLFHRELIRRFNDSLLEAGRVIGAIAAICFFIFMLSKAMIWLNVPSMLQSAATSIVQNKIVFLLVVNLLLIFMGMIMDDISCCLLAGIFLLPLASHYGVDPYHFAAIVGINTGLGNLTPPVAPNLYFAASIGNIPVNVFPPNKYVRTVATYLIFGHLPVLVLITYIPDLSLFLPNLWAG